MHRPTPEPLSFLAPWALHVLRLVVPPALLALTLLSASVLALHWGPGLPATPEASSTTAASARDTGAQPRPTAIAEATPIRLDPMLARLQAP